MKFHFYTDHDRGKSDQPFLPDGENNWTGDKYGKKLANLASVIRAMSEKNGRWHAVLGLAEVENDRVLEDLTAPGAAAVKSRTRKSSIAKNRFVLIGMVTPCLSYFVVLRFACKVSIIHV